MPSAPEPPTPYGHNPHARHNLELLSSAEQAALWDVSAFEHRTGRVGSSLPRSLLLRRIDQHSTPNLRNTRQQAAENVLHWSAVTLHLLSNLPTMQALPDDPEAHVALLRAAYAANPTTEHCEAVTTTYLFTVAAQWPDTHLSNLRWRVKQASGHNLLRRNLREHLYQVTGAVYPSATYYLTQTQTDSLPVSHVA